MQLKSIIDSHTHSSFSPDSEMSLKEAVGGACERGLGGIVITDHLELAHPDTVTWQTPFDIKGRSQHINQLRQEHKEEFKILKGLELGFQPEIIARSASTLVRDHDFDFVILSTHVVDNIDLGKKTFYAEKTKEDAYNKYLDMIYESIATFNDFDVIGHIGYLCRYAPYQDRSMKYHDYREKLDAILSTVIAKGKGIEVNTAGYRNKLGGPHPDFDILKRYHELGGSVITIGSDAHNTLRIGDQFEVVIQRLKDLGFRFITYFENRKPVFTKI
jgi:histidinol-phosphatase (PHP family)